MNEVTPRYEPLAIIATAIERGVDPDRLEKLLELQERWEKHRAAEAFGKAIAEFQRRCPPIRKRREAKGERMRFRFASLDDVMAVAGPILADVGLAVSFSTKMTEFGIEVTCRVRCGIHFEDHALCVPIPHMNVSDTQRYGAALSYAKRYALCAALNIVVTDEDDENQLAEGISDSQIEQINLLIEECEKVGHPVDMGRFFGWLGVSSLEQLTRRDAEKAILFLKAKKGGGK
jgi:hypothetical protein